MQDFQVSTPKYDDKMNRASPRSIAIYKDHLKTRLHFSLYPFITRIFISYKVVQTYLTSNSIRIICAFIILCYDL